MNNTANSTDLKNFRKKKFFWRTLIVCCLLLPLLFLNKCGSFGCKGAGLPIGNDIIAPDSVAKPDNVTASDSIVAENSVSTPTPASMPATASSSTASPTTPAAEPAPMPESHETPLQTQAAAPEPETPVQSHATPPKPIEPTAPHGEMASADHIASAEQVASAAPESAAVGESGVAVAPAASETHRDTMPAAQPETHAEAIAPGETPAPFFYSRADSVSAENAPDSVSADATLTPDSASAGATIAPDSASADATLTPASASAGATIAPDSVSAGAIIAPAAIPAAAAVSASEASAQKSKKAPVASADSATTREPLPANTTTTVTTTSTDTTSTTTPSTDSTSVLPVASVPATADTAIATAKANADTATAKADTADTAIANAIANADTATVVPFAPKKDVVALRTNLLYDAVLVPNIGIEVWLGKQFTLGADWFGTWLSSDKKHIYWQGYGGYLTLRYYFGKQAAERRFTGHHVGLYGSALTYDVEFGGKGYQAAKFGFGGGIEYGYSLPVHKCLTIDFNIGVGYQGGEYKTYQPTVDGTGHYVWLATYNRNWWGPTKAEISLKWLIAPVDKKKGGEQ